MNVGGCTGGGGCGVFWGETHDRPADHNAQLQLIQALHRQNSQLAIGMEMFQRPFQPVLDEYLDGTISATQLRQRSQYDRRWGFPWEYYAPILEYAQTHRIPVLALNTPTEVTQRVARKGLAALMESDLAWIPPLADIHTDHEAYRQFLRPIYDDFHQEHGSSQGFENFVAAQVLWDETMAETIAAFWLGNPTSQVVVLAGQGHIMYGYGIPSRVDRRITADLEQRLILLNPDPSRLAEPAIADFLWLAPD
ncbi:MAG: ChaN family lipoprotein [Leptolyngbyaceae cyanobacterium SL_7_1]|nr:ChaN family lipoprotein [Leptolyngbyaceae cyanobacterium SL_7_1]